MAKASSSGLSSALVGGADTIVACATGPGRGPLAVLRVSGPATARVAAAVCPALDFDAAWRAQLVRLRAADGETVERAVAIPYRSPRSYTGEDMIELMMHGSPVVVHSVVDALVAAGSRPAQPGEFTRRAVANGKLDLVQAEAVRDLIAADTAWQAHNARQQLAGALSGRFRELRERLVSLLSLFEASLDFVGQGVEVATEELEEGIRGCRALIDELLATAAAGERIRNGARVVVIGPVNSGKSTLFNHLVGSERAIVTPRPGTTRDAIEATLEIGGLEVTLVDTAGLRQVADPVEREGVRRTHQELASAQAVIRLWAGDEADPGELPAAAVDLPLLRLRSKADLLAADERVGDEGWMAVSCRTGKGLQAAVDRLAAMVGEELQDLGGEVAISRRHRHALEAAARELAAVDPAMPELAAEGLRWALDEVRQLTGDVAADEVLDSIFSTFCVGK
jgi:tRNA modification GTPase